jgi:hypothetical protein
VITVLLLLLDPPVRKLPILCPIPGRRFPPSPTAIGTKGSDCVLLAFGRVPASSSASLFSLLPVPTTSTVELKARLKTLLLGRRAAFHASIPSEVVGRVMMGALWDLVREAAMAKAE